MLLGQVERGCLFVTLCTCRLVGRMKLGDALWSMWTVFSSASLNSEVG